jgi:hypothetical protein
MEKIIKYSNRFGFVLALCAIVISECSCSAPKPTPDPLTGFHAASKKLDQALIDDYQNYMQKNLSPEEKQNLGPYPPVDFFEDDTGQHAVKIKIGLNGTVWEHILIYDKNDNRIKTIKYASGNYRS